MEYNRVELAHFFRIMILFNVTKALLKKYRVKQAKNVASSCQKINYE